MKANLLEIANVYHATRVLDHHDEGRVKLDDCTYIECYTPDQEVLSMCVLP